MNKKPLSCLVIQLSGACIDQFHTKDRHYNNLDRSARTKTATYIPLCIIRGIYTLILETFILNKSSIYKKSTRDSCHTIDMWSVSISLNS